jgi:hypothetical protein
MLWMEILTLAVGVALIVTLICSRKRASFPASVDASRHSSAQRRLGQT